MTKDDLLLWLCKQTAQVPAGGYDPNIYSVPHIARRIGKTKYTIRKLLKELEADGLVHKTHEGGVDEDGYPHCYHGWSITKKACDSELYKKCEKEAYQEYKDWSRAFDEEWRREEEKMIGNR